MDDRVVNKVVQHGRVFADFWLGVVGAGVQGLAQVVGKPRADNVATQSVRQMIEGAVDRTATGLRAALDGARTAAASAEAELQKLHAQEGKDAKARSTVRRTLETNGSRPNLPSSGEDPRSSG